MFKWLKTIFKKDKKEEIKVIEPENNKMDLSQYKMNFNIKSICYFEKITNTSFFQFDDSNVLHLLYATFLINNPETKISFNVFESIMNNEKIAKWALTQFKDALSLIYQFNKAINDNREEKFSMASTTTMSDFATSLIIDYGMDADYVMYKMDIWEIEGYYEAVNTHIKREMEMERFWTYIKVLPHIDGKKCKSPEALVPFDWEREDKKKDAVKFMDENKDAIVAFFNKNQKE